MANLLSRIHSEYLQAVKSRDEAKRSTLRMLQAALKNREIAKRTKGEDTVLSDDDIQAVIRTETKRRHEAAALYRKGGVQERARQEDAEAAILQEYLPPQLSDEEIQTEVTAAVRAVNARDQRDIGKVMGVLMQKLRGRADGARIQKMVEDILKGQSAA
ncbi:MAG: GatB/YqeY domain-containing protein [Parcubacteria group bacterium]|nr:GatB/YqeY domain-containing protein [Parcubacteria group bacterium]